MLARAMKICLINPRIPPAPMNFQFAMDLVDCAFSHIPLGLCTLGALTPADIDVTLVDENVEAVDLDLDCDVVAMTGIYCQRERMFELADAFRARGKVVVLGGAITQDMYEECRAHADVLFLGEAEYTWPRFCQDFRAGKNEVEYTQAEFVDMRDSPVPRFELLKAKRYSSACVQATRGCPYRCEYCDVPQKQGNRPRSKPVDRVLEEVERLVALGFDSVFFVDDHFVGNRKYARELLTALGDLVKRLPIQVYFYAQTTLNVARDEEMLALFHAANFRRFFVGIETSNVAKLRAMDKTQNAELDIREAIARIQSYNITVWAGIILGLDDDNASAFEEQYRFITESGITPTLIGLLQAMPGAPLYERIKRERRLRVLPALVGSNPMGTLRGAGHQQHRTSGVDDARAHGAVRRVRTQGVRTPGVRRSPPPVDGPRPARASGRLDGAQLEERQDHRPHFALVPGRRSGGAAAARARDVGGGQEAGARARGAHLSPRNLQAPAHFLFPGLCRGLRGRQDLRERRQARGGGRMKILLINPLFPPSLWDFSLSRDLEGSRYTHPPLALPTLAALTPPVHQVALVDENVEPVDFEADADVVGITGYWIQRHRVFAIADGFRSRGKRVVIGGPLVEASTIDEVARHADHVFQGEAEYTWPRFLTDLGAREPSARYVQADLIDMRDSPPPRYELLARNAYSTATIETSRGCPMACEFCEIPSRLGKRARTKTLEQVMTEVRAHHALGADSIFFIDDHFIGNRGHVKLLLEELGRFQREIDHGMYFTCQFTINLARDREMLELLHAANFRRVFVGIETPRKASLLSVRKKQNVVGDLVENVKILQSYNIVVWAGMVVGFDTDDPSVFDEHTEFLQAAGIPVVMSGLLQAIPGTPLYARMQREERLRDVEMAGVRGTHESLLISNIVPRNFTDAELAGGYQRMVRAIYDYEPFSERLLATLGRGERPIAKPRKATVTVKKLAIVARTMRFYLWTRDVRRRRMFVRVVGQTLRTRPEELETALMHLVVYKHLRLFYFKIAELPIPKLAKAAHSVRVDDAAGAHL